MTVINNLDDPDEIKRYEEDFKLIARYLQARRRALEFERMSVIGVGVDLNQDIIRDIWNFQFPGWIRELLTREI